MAVKGQHRGEYRVGRQQHAEAGAEEAQGDRGPEDQQEDGGRRRGDRHRIGGDRRGAPLHQPEPQELSGSAPLRIFTIGYEGATQAELVARLKEAGVALLADVRAVPLSRRPGFSKNILAAGLREAGINYIGLKALGTPPEGREAARKHDLAGLRRIYGGQLELPEAMAQGAQLLDLARESPTALLCFEREPGCCHRSLLVEALMPDAEVVDLFP